ncbi:LacI family transcriptional regulator [Rhizobium chutanense]|uniref:LacI family transcriptional regulator n=1 Tax=Rhizobium chutanense TaxID=2035448 RepID=A0A2A6JE67_9HYPH|nr:LacI family DNA-binding transcriptional regulator [Rhizobium chutanense]PDT04256.1 LacI family transcriptional regulator [Rhizobium chutanense]
MSDETERRLTIDDVAKVAGVSRSTVSLVLRNSGLVAERTKIAVREAAERLGYVYNRTAAIRARHSYLVGIIIPDLTNPFYSELTAGVDQVLNDSGWISLLGNSWESSASQEKILRRMHEQNVDAVIICPVTAADQSAAENLARSGLRVLQVLRRTEADTSYLGIDYAHGVALAVDHLSELGHTDIVLLGGERVYSAATERYEGYISSMRSHGLEPRHVPCALRRSAAAEKVRELFDKEERRPTALVCFNDVVAIGAMASLERMGLKVGRDVSVVGFDNVADAEFVQPPLTTIDTHARQLGERAATLVLDSIRNGSPMSATTIMETSLVVRDSTGKAPLRS